MMYQEHTLKEMVITMYCDNYLVDMDDARFRVCYHWDDIDWKKWSNSPDALFAQLLCFLDSYDE